MEHTILNLKYYGGQDQYSDGDIEDELLNICKDKEKIPEILKSDKRWPILYHLSDIRENLLDWYEFGPDTSLLEIGAGCGALTGLFCRKVKKVTAIELSKRRSEINVLRNGDYGNLEIMVGNFEDVEIKEKFDYITLIGVLEYASSYIQSEFPFHDMLVRVNKYLKPQGQLIIAIENKYGLKYWSGAAEDHTGITFDGIENYHSNNVRTFSKTELENLLQEAGFSKTQFYYPVPDYKLPSAIYSSTYLPKPGDLRNISLSYDRKRFLLFDEGAAFDGLCQSQQFEFFSNSFLVIAGI